MRFATMLNVHPEDADVQFPNVSLDKLAAEAKRLRLRGFQAVQLGFNTELLTEDLCADVSTQLAQARLSVVAVSGYTDLIDPDEQVRERNAAYLERIIDLAPLFDTDIVVTWGGFKHKGMKRPWDEMMEATADIISAAEINGVMLAFELYDERVVGTTEEILCAIESIGSDNLVAVLDPPNTMKPSDLKRQGDYMDELAERLVDCAVLAHAKDVLFRDDQRTFPAAGQGQMDYEAYLRSLRKMSYESYLVVEHVNADTLLPARKHIEDAMKRVGK
ncbi:MAG: sugar phosphate isomerase/epimerase [Planctomycetes bacterium]|nr:sugar phosphate isomerase/epimerase [Planctomycetota bacterium]